MRRIAEGVLLSGAQVRLLATSATVRGDVNAFRLLQREGLVPKILPGRSGGRVRPEIHYTRQSGLECRVVDVGQTVPGGWEQQFGAAFDAAFDQELKQFRPDLIVLRGAGAADARRSDKARRQGIRVVLALSDNHSVTTACDGAFCHTAWLAGEHYSDGSLQPEVLPPVAPLAEVVSAEAERLCTALIPPSRQNGLYFQVRLAEQLSMARPDDPILVLPFAGATPAGQGLLETARAGGFDLGQYENILLGDPAATPRQTWAAARVLVAPLLSGAPAEVLAEALVNGIPTLASDRGGAGELLGDSGFILPLPLDYSEETRTALPVAAVEPWVDIIERWTDDAVWERESARAREAGRRFQPEVAGPRYLEYFQKVTGLV